MTEAKQTWKALIVQAQRQTGYTDQDGRTCHEIGDVAARFASPKEAKTLLRAIRSHGWYYPSDDELTSIILGEDEQHEYSYAASIHEQLPGVVALLADHPRTRRAVIIFSQEGRDWANQPSLIYAYFRRKEGKLHITLHARSIDLLFGLPANAYHAATLLEYIAQQIGTDTGTVTIMMNSAHTFSEYDTHLKRVLA